MERVNADGTPFGIYVKLAMTWFSKHWSMDKGLS